MTLLLVYAAFIWFSDDTHWCHINESLQRWRQWFLKSSVSILKRNKWIYYPWADKYLWTSSLYCALDKWSKQSFFCIFLSGVHLDVLYSKFCALLSDHAVWVGFIRLIHLHFFFIKALPLHSSFSTMWITRLIRTTQKLRLVNQCLFWNIIKDKSPYFVSWLSMRGNGTMFKLTFPWMLSVAVIFISLFRISFWG